IGSAAFDRGVDRLPFEILSQLELAIYSRGFCFAELENLSDPLARESGSTYSNHGVALCLPAQEDLNDEILSETSLWARAGAAGFVRHMSQTGDKRRRGDLDLFVLALINSGVSTAYEL